MIVLAGADLVLPHRIVSAAALVIDAGRIVEIVTSGPAPAGPARVDVSGCLIVPGFIDVHVHGVEGFDTLGADEAIASIARRLPKYGVTAFCPTLMACTPDDLARALQTTRAMRHAAHAIGARVLPAHLESNFINPDYRGAQPLECLCLPPRRARAEPGTEDTERRAKHEGHVASAASFSAADILEVIGRHRTEVGIVTLAPELPFALDLVTSLVGAGHRVSVGHSGATLEQGLAAIDAGARHATHLFNRMPPFTHRAPGLVGAVLDREEVAAEIICDGFHVHPVVARAAIAAKRPRRTMVITDGTAGAGLPVGARTALGGRPITVRETACFLDDGTLAGSSLTMDRAFRTVVKTLKIPLVDAARMCATTQAEELGLPDQGLIARGAIADLVVLDSELHVRQTFVGGELAWSSD